MITIAKASNRYKFATSTAKEVVVLCESSLLYNTVTAIYVEYCKFLEGKTSFCDLNHGV